MAVRRDYEVSSRLKVILLVGDQGHGKLVSTLSDVKEHPRAVIRAKDASVEGVLELKSDSGSLHTLTLLLDNSDELAQWIPKIDPGWRPVPILSVGLGCTVASLGATGYIKAGSKASLISGGLIGLTMCSGAWLIRSGRRPRVGHAIAATSSLLITASMGPKALKTKSLYPGGGVAIGGVICGICNIAALFPRLPGLS